MAHTCAVARHLEKRIRRESMLELVMPAQLNIVCFRHRGGDALNAGIIAAVQESGIAAPSATTIDGKVTIRAAIFNHRTMETDVDALVDEVVAIGAKLVSRMPRAPSRSGQDG
jgi:glutamate/tyrosine decarboxylase-like PLP-dependent enzyme